jgi:hypothetical protein
LIYLILRAAYLMHFLFRLWMVINAYFFQRVH